MLPVGVHLKNLPSGCVRAFRNAGSLGSKSMVSQHIRMFRAGSNAILAGSRCGGVGAYVAYAAFPVWAIDAVRSR